MDLSELWEAIGSSFATSFIHDGIWFAPVSDVFALSFFLGFSLAIDFLAIFYLSRLLYSFFNALIQRYIYPGRKMIISNLDNKN